MCIAPTTQQHVLDAFVKAVAAPRAAVSRPHSGAVGVVRSYEEALSALDLADRLGLSAPVLNAADLLVFPVLMRDRAAMADLVRTVLGPLAQRPRRRRAAAGDDLRLRRRGLRQRRGGPPPRPQRAGAVLPARTYRRPDRLRPGRRPPALHPGDRRARRPPARLAGHPAVIRASARPRVRGVPPADRAAPASGGAWRGSAGPAREPRASSQETRSASSSGARVWGAGALRLETGADRQADLAEGLQLVRGEDVEEVLADGRDMAGRRGGQRGEAGVGEGGHPAAAVAVGGAAPTTQPCFSSAETAWDSRLREDWDASASSLIRWQRPGASDSRTRIS